jgi:ribosome-associated protein
MIFISNSISIDENEIKLEFIRSSGPGGQNVNKVATAVLLRFDVRNSNCLPAHVKKRLTGIAGSRISDDGVIVIKAQSLRSQEQNRKEAIQRLVDLIKKAAIRPKRRIKTMPSLSSIQHRLETKHKKSKIKKLRQKPLKEADF